MTNDDLDDFEKSPLKTLYDRIEMLRILAERQEWFPGELHTVILDLLFQI